MAKYNGKKNGKMISVVLLLPLLAIIIYLVMNHFKSLSLEGVQKISISAPGAAEVVLEETEDIDVFLDMINGSSSTNSAIRDISGELPVLLTFVKEDKTMIYKFYPSLNLSGCILVSPEEDYYLLEPDTAAQMLLRSEFEYLYTDSFMPKLTLCSGSFKNTITPVDAKWSYYKSNGELYDFDHGEFATGKEIFTIYKGMENSMVFSPSDEVFPCEMEITYTPDGEEPLTDIKDISELELEVDTMLEVTVTAKWKQQNSTSAFGEAEYKFNMLYDVPAVLTLENSDLYSPGDVIIIHADHINNSELFNLSTFLNSGDGADRILDFDIIGADHGIALIPIGLETAPSVYTLNISSEASSLKEQIDVVTEEATEHDPIYISAEDYVNMLSMEKYNELFDKLSKLTEKRPDNDYISSTHFDLTKSKLNLPVESTPKYYFGDIVNLGIPNENAVDDGVRISNGLIYEVSEGTKVKSVQKGEIIFSGEFATTGNTVVVYHGYGIYSYYFHLAELNHKAGYVLGNGETVGVAGSTGFTNGKNILNFAVSVDGVFVDPQSLFNQ